MNGDAPPSPPAPPTSSTPSGPDGAAGAGADKPLDFAGVIALITSWKPRAGAAPHGEFWKFPYAKFVAYEVPIFSENGKARLVVPGKPDESNLILALEKKPLIVHREDGTTAPFDPEKAMPPSGKGAKPKPEEIARIRQWIADGAPEKR